MFYRPHKRLQTPVGTESMTKQSHKHECDIHNILAQFKRTNIWTHVTNARASYEDLPGDLDYQAALNTILQAQGAFDDLPSAVRDHFSNDPERFLSAIGDPGQREKLTEFGVFRKPAEPAPVRPPQPSGDNQAGKDPAAS